MPSDDSLAFFSCELPQAWNGKLTLGLEYRKVQENGLSPGGASVTSIPGAEVNPLVCLSQTRW